MTHAFPILIRNFGRTKWMFMMVHNNKLIVVHNKKLIVESGYTKKKSEFESGRRVIFKSTANPEW